MGSPSEYEDAHWITERAQVLVVQDDALWVAADKTSACGSCKAKSGCGTSLLAKLGRDQVAIRALLPQSLQSSHFVAGDEIELAIDRTAFVKVALVMYVLPLLSLMVAITVTLGQPEYQVAMAAFLGLLTGGWVASRVLKRWRNDERLQPVVLRRALVAGEHVLQLS